MAKLLHIPTGRTYSCYSWNAYEDNMNKSWIEFHQRCGRKPSKHIKLPDSEVKILVR